MRDKIVGKDRMAGGRAGRRAGVLGYVLQCIEYTIEAMCSQACGSSHCSNYDHCC